MQPSVVFQKSCLIQLKYLFLSHHGFFSQGFRMVFPLRLRVKTRISCERSFDFKKLFQSQQMRRPKSFIFLSLRKPYFSTFRKDPYRDLFVQIPKVPLWFLHFWEIRMVDFLSRLRVNPEPRFARYLPCRFGLNLSLVPTKFLVLTRWFLPVPSWLFPLRNPCFVYPSKERILVWASSHEAFSKDVPSWLLPSRNPYFIHSSKERIILGLHFTRHFSKCPIKVPVYPFPQFKFILIYLRPIQVKGLNLNHSKESILSHPWDLIKMFISHHFGISPKVPSRSPHFYHLITSSSRTSSPQKPFRIRFLSLKKPYFQNKFFHTQFRFADWGIFSKFGVLSLPLSSAFNRLISKEGHLWTPQIFQRFVKMTLLPLTPFSEKIKAISKLNFSHSSDFLD